MKKIFELYEDDRFVMKGTVEDLAERLIISDSAIYMAAKSGTLLFKRFSVKQVGVVYENKQTTKPIPNHRKKSKHQEKLEYLIWHLNHYGNTSIKGDPKEYQKELQELGIDIYFYKSAFSKKDYMIERV